MGTINDKESIMQVTVYHRDNFDPRESSGFSRVAVVQAPTDNINEALEYAYHHTNNINGSWSKGKTIEWKGEVHNNEDFCENVEFVGQYPVGKDGTVYGARSTSVRDVMYCGGGKYEVDSIGFKKVA
jgi:hypothetical protein